MHPERLLKHHHDCLSHAPSMSSQAVSASSHACVSDWPLRDRLATAFRTVEGPARRELSVWETLPEGVVETQLDQFLAPARRFVELRT